MGGAARVVEIDRAEVAGQLVGAAADQVGALAALVAKREQDGPRLEERGVAVTGESKIAGLLEPGSGPAASRKDGADSKECLHTTIATIASPGPQRRDREEG